MRKADMKLRIKAKNERAKLTMEAIRPFVVNGLNGAWKAMLSAMDLLTTGEVASPLSTRDGYPSSAPALEGEEDLDWSLPAWWYSKHEVDDDRLGHPIY